LFFIFLGDKQEIIYYDSVHRSDATLLAHNADWGKCRVDSVSRETNQP